MLDSNATPPPVKASEVTAPIEVPDLGPDPMNPWAVAGGILLAVCVLLAVLAVIL